MKHRKNLWHKKFEGTVLKTCDTTAKQKGFFIKQETADPTVQKSINSEQMIVAAFQSKPAATI